MGRIYKAEYEDEEMVVFERDNDAEAMSEVFKHEKEHGIVYNLYELDENYDEVRTII